MRQMRGWRLLYVTMAVIIALSAMAAVPLCATQPAAQTLDAVSVFAAAPPEIDGFVSGSEWASAAGVTSSAATLNGTLDDMGTASSVEVSFEWGTTIAYGNETAPEAMTSTDAFTASLTGLQPGTTYHFRAKAVGDGTDYGEDMTFTTNSS